MDNNNENKLFTFKFFKLDENNKKYLNYDDIFGINKTAIRDNIRYHLRDKQEYEIDENKIGIIEKIIDTEDYFLGKYSVIHNKNCTYIEHRKYSNLSLDEKKEVGTSCYTYFFIDFNKNILIYLYRSEINGYNLCFNKALRKTLSLKIYPTPNWKETFLKKFKEIKAIEFRYLDLEKNQNIFDTIDKMGEIKQCLVYESIKLKVKLGSQKLLIKNIVDMNVDDFDKFSVKVIDDKGDIKDLDFIDKMIQKKEELLLNPIDLSEKAPTTKIIEIFKNIC